MSMQDPISDMFSRIRNAQMVCKDYTTMPLTKMKMRIAQVLQDEGYINGFSEVADAEKPTLMITLRYHNEEPVIATISRVSRPGLRVYKGSDELPEVQDGLGIAIISTSKGVMTDRRARELNLGGEVLGYVS